MPKPHRHKLTIVLFAALLVGALLTQWPARAAVSDEDLLWSYEQSIYAGRARADLSFYVNHADVDYAGWPPQAAAPLGRAALAAGAKAAAATGRNGEVLELQKTLIRITDGGRLALVFYTTHRTARADGSAVDERFENIHVWLKRGNDWKIVGGMARPVPMRTASSASS